MTTTRSLFIGGDCAQKINGGLMKCSGNVAHKINQILFIDISYYDISVFSFIKDRSSARDKYGLISTREGKGESGSVSCGLHDSSSKVFCK